jgi:hypothetical protein
MGDDPLRITEETSLRKQLTPLTADRHVADVRNAIDEKQPREIEVKGQTPGEVTIEVELGVHVLGQELEQGRVAPSEPVDVVGPVDPQATPNHDGEQRKVDPVHPTRCA